jgi:hypothetical protein
MKLASEDLCEGPGEQRLADTGYVFEKRVSTAQQRNEQLVDGFPVADDDLGNRRSDPFDGACSLSKFDFRRDSA